MKTILILLGLLAMPRSAYAATQTILLSTNPVNQIVAGTNVTISPTSGKGVVTVNATGGGGDITAAGNNTFTGLNVFQSSVTVGATIYTSTNTLGTGATTAQGSMLVNGWQIVASTHVFSQPFVRLTGLDPNKQYEILFRLYKETAGILQFRLNDDSQAKYGWGCHRINFNTGPAVSNVDGDTEVQFSDTNINDASGLYGKITIGVSGNPSGQNWIFGRHEMSTSQANGGTDSCGWYYYNGAINLSSITMSVQAGTFTGYVYLLQLNSPLP